MFFEQAAVALQFLVVDRYAQAWFLGSPPPWPLPDWERVGEDVVFHDRCRLLVAVGGVGQGEQDMLSGGGGNPEFAMGVLAHTQGMMVGHQGQVDEPADGPNPVRAEAQHVGPTAVDHPQHFGRAPQPFVRGNAH